MNRDSGVFEKLSNFNELIHRSLCVLELGQTAKENFRLVRLGNLQADFADLRARIDDQKFWELRPPRAEKMARLLLEQEQHIERFAKEEADAAEAATKASAIVLAHSALDHLLFDCVSIAAAADTPRALGCFGDKTVRISDVAAKHRDELLGSAQTRWLTDIERQSIEKKLQVLVVLSPSDLLAEVLRAHKATLLIDEIERLRTEVVHRRTEEYLATNVRDVVDRVQRFALYLAVAIASEK